METYKVDTSIDANKVFLVKRSELFGRFDPSVYCNNFQFISQLFENKKLSDVAFINPTTNLSSLNYEDNISFIQMDAVDEHLGNLKYIETKKVTEKTGFTRFKENDLIWAKITPCMQNGKSAIVRNTINGFALGSTEFFIIRPKNENIKVEYLHFLLRDKRVLETAMKYFGGSAGQQRVSKDFLLNFNVPVPPIEIQENIVSIIQNAYAQKQAKEAEAKELLLSIDTYLLNELGITLPEKDSSLEARIFTTKFSEVVGGRFDPDYHQIFYRKFIDGLISINSKKLSELTTDIFQGVGKDEVESSEYKLLKVKNIQKGNVINYNDVEYVRNVPSNKVLQKGDIISPFIGEAIRQIKFSNFNNSGSKFTIDNNTGVIRVLETVNHEFTCECLNSSIGKIQINRLIGGGGVPFLGSNNVKEIFIPLPPLEKQNEIAEHIAAIRANAKALQEEAEEILAAAKQQVEQIILG